MNNRSAELQKLLIPAGCCVMESRRNWEFVCVTQPPLPIGTANEGPPVPEKTSYQLPEEAAQLPIIGHVFVHKTVAGAWVESEEDAYADFVDNVLPKVKIDPGSDVYLREPVELRMNAEGRYRYGCHLSWGPR